MIRKNYFGILGSVAVIAGALSPMLHLPIIGNWNYWDIDPVLASLVFVFSALGLITAVFDKPRILRFCGWAVLVVTLFTLAAVYFKVNDYFSFIPFKKLASAASGLVHYRYLGWATILVGAMVMIISARTAKPD